MRHFLKWIREPWRIIASPKLSTVRFLIPDKLFLHCQYRYFTGEKLNLKEPSNFNEKLQWLKLYDRKPEYTRWADKYAVKQYIRETLGETYVVPTFGVWDRFEQIPWDSLPNQFVLKCTHDSAGLVICTDKTTFDKKNAQEKLEACQKRNFFYSGREWPYKNIKPRILAEQYLEDNTFHELRDYKIFTFNGIPKIMHLVSNRQNAQEETYGDFFDMDFNHLDLTMGHENAPICPEKPRNFQLMKEFAQKLAKGTAQLRVDFYEVDGQLFFGELTFFQDSGYAEIAPPAWNGVLGSWIQLPEK
jgi:hypothetical protein